MRCTVICVDGTHGPIELPDGEPVILGRSPITGITDSKVSRQHSLYLFYQFGVATALGEQGIQIFIFPGEKTQGIYQKQFYVCSYT